MTVPPPTARPQALAVALTLALTLIGPAHAQDLALPCPENRLYNAGFEGGFSARGRPAVQVGLGWQPWLSGEDLGQAEGLRFFPLRRGRGADEAILEGLWSQGVERLGTRKVGGLWQRARATAGADVLAYAWVSLGEAESGPRPGGPPAGEPEGAGMGGQPGQLARLGLDPFGGIDPDAAHIAWTAPITLTAAWAPLVLPPLAAQSASVTLFLAGTGPDLGLGDALRWDAVCLSPAAAAAPPPEPTPAPLVTLDPSTPEPPPATLAVILAGQIAATARADALSGRATAWAERPVGLRGPGGLGALFSPGGDRRYGPAPPELPDAERSWSGRAYDSAGLAVLALAAFLAGLRRGRLG